MKKSESPVKWVAVAVGLASAGAVAIFSDHVSLVGVIAICSTLVAMYSD